MLTTNEQDSNNVAKIRSVWNATLSDLFLHWLINYSLFDIYLLYFRWNAGSNPSCRRINKSCTFFFQIFLRNQTWIMKNWKGLHVVWFNWTMFSSVWFSVYGQFQLIAAIWDFSLIFGPAWCFYHKYYYIAIKMHVRKWHAIMWMNLSNKY